MLDVCTEAEIAPLWEQTQLQASLPTSQEEFFGKSGAKTDHDLREFDRYYLRCQGVARSGTDSFGVYLNDCSRAGMGFISLSNSSHATSSSCGSTQNAVTR